MNRSDPKRGDRLNAAAATVRSDMGDVHGSKPGLLTLVFDSVKWATVICSLLKDDSA
jgi:hypothetical protein